MKKGRKNSISPSVQGQYNDKCIDLILKLSSSSNVPLMSGMWLILLEYTWTKMNDQEERRIKRKQKRKKGMYQQIL